LSKRPGTKKNLLILEYGILKNIMWHFIQTVANSVLAADVAVFKIINTHHKAFFDWFFLLITYFGNGWVIIPLFFIFIFWRSSKSRRAHVLIVAALACLISGLSNVAVKQVVDRPRPSAYFISPDTNSPAAEGRLYSVHAVGKRFYSHSFPSGHANTAFTLATLAVLIFGMSFWPAFLFAILVAYSRVYLGVHFPLDALGGAFMGSLITLAVWYGLALIAPSKS
jgi:undecaprenyl-diphosphatase